MEFNLNDNMDCWCGKMLDYMDNDCYACPIHGWDYLKPNVLRVEPTDLDVKGNTHTNNNNWCVIVEIVDDEEIRKCEGLTINVKRDNREMDVPASRCAIGTKSQIKKWLKHYNLDFDEIRGIGG